MCLFFQKILGDSRGRPGLFKRCLTPLENNEYKPSLLNSTSHSSTEYEFDINQYRYLLNKNMGQVMNELGLFYPFMTFLIAKQGQPHRNKNKNTFTLYINDEHQVIDIIRG